MMCCLIFRHTKNTACPTRKRTRHFFNNSNTDEDIATKFEQEYVRCVRNEEECVCGRRNILISGKIIKGMAGSVASGTLCVLVCVNSHFALHSLKYSATWFTSFCKNNHQQKR
jgi:hypothetical protein